MEYSNVDDVLSHIRELLFYHHGNVDKDDSSISLLSPIVFKLNNPLAQFLCDSKSKGFVAKSVAESLYLLSGMNGTDFIYPFRKDEGLSVNIGKYDKVLGSELRFLGLSDRLLGSQTVSGLRQNKTSDFTDQLAIAVDILKNGRENDEAVIRFSSVQKTLITHYAWLRSYRGQLDMFVCGGKMNYESDLYCKFIAPFLFMHQIISELTNIPLGNAQFMVGWLYTNSHNAIENAKNYKPPLIKMQDFKYPNGNLTLRDIDTLLAIMAEFVNRLDENSLNRANPFDGDNRVIRWQDCAEVFRAWKAEQLGYKIDMEQNFYHPQLRFIYKGEAI